MSEDAVAVAEAFVSREFASCSAALLAGSAARGEATPRSDLDVVVVDDAQHPIHAVRREGAWLVELFVFPIDALRKTLNQEGESRIRVPFHASLCSHAVVLCDPGSIASEIQALAREVLDRGPVAATEAELAGVRYMLTSALEDLDISDDPEERAFEAVYVAQLMARLELLRAGGWMGQGRWLLRSLREVNAVLASDLSAALAEGDTGAISQAGHTVLAAAGGALLEGFERVLGGR